MEPEEWENMDISELPAHEALKLFRNQSMITHTIFFMIGLIVAMVSFVGFFFLTGTWEEAVINAGEGDGLIIIAAFTATLFIVSIYVILGYLVPAGGPALNFFYAFLATLIAWGSTGLVFSETRYLLPFGLERVFPFASNSKYIVLGAITVLIPWTVLIRHVSHLAKENSENLREFEQRHMPYPMFNWGGKSE